MNKNRFQNPHLKERKSFAKKSLGQNFLVDQSYIDKIISALDPQTGETIIEIGAGRGALTEKLVESGADIIAVELDRDLIPLLRKEFGKYENFTLVEQNALEINFAEIIKNRDLDAENQKAKLVANLPYYISTAILQKIIEQSENFSKLVLMLQREVVERITAKPGNAERGFLTVLVEAAFVAENLFDVPPNSFIPAPKVWSSVVRLITKNNSDTANKDKSLFRKIVSLGFNQKRKTILNNLKNSPDDISGKFDNKGGLINTLEKLKIEPSRRAETLTFAEWKSLSNFLGD